MEAESRAQSTSTQSARGDLAPLYWAPTLRALERSRRTRNGQERLATAIGARHSQPTTSSENQPTRFAGRPLSERAYRSAQSLISTGSLFRVTCAMLMLSVSPTLVEIMMASWVLELGQLKEGADHVHMQQRFMFIASCAEIFCLMQMEAH